MSLRFHLFSSGKLREPLGKSFSYSLIDFAQVVYIANVFFDVCLISPLRLVHLATI